MVRRQRGAAVDQRAATTTVRCALQVAERRLVAAGIPSAALDARVLLRALLTSSAAALYLLLDEPLAPEALAAFQELINRRAAGTPVAYLTGSREFYGLALRVTTAVLIPRPETELLVERAAVLVPQNALVADVGTGSGAIAVAVAQMRPDVRLLAIDNSLDACRVARANVYRLGQAARVKILAGDLLTALNGPLDAVLANLPYLTSEEMRTLQRDVRQEPLKALDGGPDGLELYRRLFADLRQRRPTPTLVLCEIGPEQAAAALALAHAALPAHQATVQQDLAGRPRLLEVVNGRVR